MKEISDRLQGGFAILVNATTIAFASVAAGDGALPWLLAILIVIGVALVPQVLFSAWLDHQPTGWSTETAISVVMSAALVCVITLLSAVAGALSVCLVLVAYVGGRRSN